MTESESTKRLQTLAEHRTLLQQVLTTAQERVLIISPFISISAIDSDNISTLVRLAIARGVQVRVFIDSHLNSYYDGTMKDRAKDGIAELVKAGAQVGVVNNIHNKTLARDNDLIAEGSFNWLSAVRIRNNECQREERTLVFTGEGVSKMIAQELDKIEETGYGVASLKKGDTTNDARLGLLVALAFILAIPIMIGKDIGDRILGFICTALLLGFLVGLYWLKSKLDSTSDSTTEIPPGGYVFANHEDIMNDIPGGICTDLNVWGNVPGDTIGPRLQD